MAWPLSPFFCAGQKCLQQGQQRNLRGGVTQGGTACCAGGTVKDHMTGCYALALAAFLKAQVTRLPSQQSLLAAARDCRCHTAGAMQHSSLAGSLACAAASTVPLAVPLAVPPPTPTPSSTHFHNGSCSTPVTSALKREPPGQSHSSFMQVMGWPLLHTPLRRVTGLAKSAWACVPQQC
jgi:hypothetical protein